MISATRPQRQVSLTPLTLVVVGDTLSIVVVEVVVGGDCASVATFNKINIVVAKLQFLIVFSPVI